MVFRSSFLALAMIAGIAHTASASSVMNVDLKLRYDGTFYSDGALYTDAAENDENAVEGSLIEPFDDYLADGNPFGIPVFQNWLRIGDEVFFRAALTLPDPDFEMTEYLDNGGRAKTCWLANVDCSSAKEVYSSKDFLSVFWDELTGVTTDLKSGGYLSYLFVPEYAGSIFRFDSGGITFNNRDARFTIVDVIQPAPVPVPFSAALLPVGIGALAMLRRRRRVVS